MPSPDEVTDNSSRPSSGKSYHSDFSGIFSSSDDESQPAAQPAAQPAPPAPAPAKTHNALFAQSLLRADRVHCTPAAGYRYGYVASQMSFKESMFFLGTPMTKETTTVPLSVNVHLARGALPNERVTHSRNLINANNSGFKRQPSIGLRPYATGNRSRRPLSPYPRSWLAQGLSSPEVTRPKATHNNSRLGCKTNSTTWVTKGYCASPMKPLDAPGPMTVNTDPPKKDTPPAESRAAEDKKDDQAEINLSPGAITPKCHLVFVKEAPADNRNYKEESMEKECLKETKKDVDPKKDGHNLVFDDLMEIVSVLSFDRCSSTVSDQEDAEAKKDVDLNKDGHNRVFDDLMEIVSVLSFDRCSSTVSDQEKAEAKKDVDLNKDGHKRVFDDLMEIVSVLSFDRCSSTVSDQEDAEAKKDVDLNKDGHKHVFDDLMESVSVLSFDRRSSTVSDQEDAEAKKDVDLIKDGHSPVFDDRMKVKDDAKELSIDGSRGPVSDQDDAEREDAIQTSCFSCCKVFKKTQRKEKDKKKKNGIRRFFSWVGHAFGRFKKKSV